MARTTIDYGIDLGTTNSAIAVAEGASAEVIRNRFGDEITASAVWRDAPGSLVVGNAAYDAAGRDPENVALRFKRFMGEDRPHVFPRDGTSLPPEALAAEVIRTLLDGAESRYGERPGAAVVTVPADFELHQCQATEHAARLAGLEACLLLQEPVAAAQAYCYQDETEQAYWLIYDMGAGTFDVALLRIEGGTPRIAGQRGDSYLGGLRIDEEIVRQCLAPGLQREYGLRVDALSQAQQIVLRQCAEKAKKQLSSPSARSAQCLETLQTGNKRGVVLVDYTVTREALDGILTPIVLRSVRICRDLLAEHHLAPGQVAKLILVGGPTYSSTLRNILADPTEGLGIPLETRFDPMTVVARGAAIWASTQPLRAASVPAAAGTYTVSFPSWPTLGDEDELEIHGRVEFRGAGGQVAGFTVEFANENSSIGWRSGRFAVADNGAFRAVLQAEKGAQNVYRVALRDGRGALQPCATIPPALVHNRGRLIEGSQLTHSVGVGLADGTVTWIALRSETLPVCAKVPLSTAWQVLRERSGDRIIIPLVEGESERASRNHEVGAVVIPASELPRDLPANTEIWLQVDIDLSRLVTATADVPAINRQFQQVIDLQGIQPLAPAEVEHRAEAALQRLDEIEKEVGDQSFPVPDSLERVHADSLRAELEQTMGSVETSPDAARLVESRSRELQSRLDAADLELAPARAARAVAWCRTVAAQYGTDEERAHLADLDARLHQYLAMDPPPTEAIDGLREEAVEAACGALDRADILPQWHFEYLEKQIYEPHGRAEALGLIERGRQALRNRDYAELRRMNAGLARLLPRPPSPASTVLGRYRH